MKNETPKDALFALIKSLVETPGPSGQEHLIREVIKAEIKDYCDEIVTDALGNLIARKGICPEFVQEQCQPEALARYAEELLASPGRYMEMKRDLALVRHQMGSTPASTRAALAIQEFLRKNLPREKM